MMGSQLRWMCAVGILVSAAACGGGDNKAAPAVAANPCPLTVEQVAAVTGEAMTLPPGGCTFFPASGRDVPHVFFVLQNPMVCNTLEPTALGFTEKLEGL